MIILLACLAGYIAYRVGTWRQSSIYWENENRANVPLGWRTPWIRAGTWIIVTGLSLYFALVISTLVQIKIGDLVGKFSFGVFLALRWIASGLSAHQKCEKEKQIIEAMLQSRPTNDT